MEEKIKNYFCDLCKEPATNICYNCSFYLCNSCSEFLHEKSINSNHNKEIINGIIPINLKCKIHTKIPLSLFNVEKKGN